nr:hypothetical protein [Tanacetum cinerariifolium]
MTRVVKDQGGLTQINNEDFHTCMFACFLSQEEPNREEGINYEEVFALVERIEALRLFLAYASFMGFMVYQTDVKSAFLYGTIKEEVYVYQPPGFEDPDYPDNVGKIDQTLFIKRPKGDILLVQIYVDDIIFGSTNKDLCKDFEKLMKDKFQMSSMGKLTFFWIKAQVDDLSSHSIKYSSPVLTQKVFANMRKVGKGFSGVDTPLFEGLIVAQQVDDVADEGVACVDVDVVPTAAKPFIPSPIPTTQPPPPS